MSPENDYVPGVRLTDGGKFRPILELRGKTIWSGEPEANIADAQAVAIRERDEHRKADRAP
jgi:hypothetical protein